MAIPVPEPGLVVSYEYLWRSEYEQGREEGRKDRPCVIVVATRVVGEQTIVTVVPVTHSAPSDPANAVEIPLVTKRRLGLDGVRSWVVATEVNRFVWPGPDVRPIAPERFDYGPLPPDLFGRVRNRVGAIAAAQRLGIVTRNG